MIVDISEDRQSGDGQKTARVSTDVIDLVNDTYYDGQHDGTERSENRQSGEKTARVITDVLDLVSDINNSWTRRDVHYFLKPCKPEPSCASSFSSLTPADLADHSITVSLSDPPSSSVD